MAGLLALLLLALAGAQLRHASAAAPLDQHQAARHCVARADAAPLLRAAAAVHDQDRPCGDPGRGVTGLACCVSAQCPAMVGAPPPASTGPLPPPGPIARFAAPARDPRGTDIRPALPAIPWRRRAAVGEDYEPSEASVPTTSYIVAAPDALRAATEADRAYVAAVRAHHAGALTTAEEYLGDPRARNPALRALARAVIPDQRFEIALLDEVARNPDRPPAVLDLGLVRLALQPAATEGLAQTRRFIETPVPGPLPMLAAPNLPVTERDVQFAKAMTIHHQGALDMARTRRRPEPPQHVPQAVERRHRRRPEPGDRAHARVGRRLPGRCRHGAGARVHGPRHGGHAARRRRRWRVRWPRRGRRPCGRARRHACCFAGPDHPAGHRAAGAAQRRPDHAAGAIHPAASPARAAGPRGARAAPLNAPSGSKGDQGALCRPRRPAERQQRVCGGRDKAAPAVPAALPPVIEGEAVEVAVQPASDGT